MSSSKKDMFSRISQLSKNAPLQESSGSLNQQPEEKKAITEIPQSAQNIDDSDTPKRKVKAVRRAKNVQIPEDLWDAYDALKEKNVTSLLMTPYILEAFREKLARDGAFEK